MREGYGVGHVYFEYQEQNQQTSLAVVASLLKQLLSQVPPSKFPKDIIGKYHDKKFDHPSSDELEMMLVSMAGSFSRAFIVCDALDEMDQYNQRAYLLPLFHRLKDAGFSLFLTTRPHPADIHDSFRSASIFELSPDMRDIRLYVEEKLSNNTRFQEVLRRGPKDLYCRVVTAIVNSAAEMYENNHNFW